MLAVKEENGTRQPPGEHWVSPWLATGMIVVLVASFIVGALIVKRVYFDIPTPRTALERELVTYKTQLARDPNDVAARVSLAQTYYRMGEILSAHSQLDIAEKIDPNLWELHFTRGLIYLDQKEINEAIIAFEYGKKINPQNHLTYFYLGEIFLKQSKFQSSVENLEEAVKLDGKMADAHYDLALAYEGLGREKKALTHYREVLKYVPSMKQAKKAIERLSR